MPVTAVVGAHWGDEGKGKVVDALAAEADLVVRYNGGTNAGHTIVSDQGTFRLHLVPSGVLHPRVTCLIGPGVVVNPDALLDELALLERHGVVTHNVLVSNRAQVVFPHHVRLDEREEERRGAGQLGTTRQGIWPAYADKAARVGVRMGDLLHPDYLATQVREQVARANRLLPSADAADAASVLARCARWREALGGRIVDTHPLVQAALRADRHILLEGHLGVMRDLDWGVYPYVTSSTCLPGGAAAGAGVPAARITRVVGVVKAYATAVGAGPFPTELHGATADEIRQAGGEYGATTGRPRRCGWFDAVAARFAAEVAGFTELAVMKLDVLTGRDTVEVATAYRHRGQTFATMPDTPTLAEVEPVYETLPGWTLPARVERPSDLPVAARLFLDRIAALVGVPVTMVGLGQRREQFLRLAPPSASGVVR
ncbi:MAG: adenylosuccinate synthase [Armatimonadota bacterium]|nr:adenylosuccinate synthase [Armatimonadota bacterium]MDR7454873.1 adenylosuccinate synthase [Armatimonadota bacterium]MDR7457807.1 adenylosuccinate synthase [Armatimonadota bacterium]MDR7497695.1 adenylosuccinate synthase [Armatimonadota bacterium]MDR7512962.1 adenylosuccinate synthase [Armatimonadota bacterium]